MFCVRVAQSLSLEQSAQKSDKSVILVPTSKLAENDFFYKYYLYPHILGILFFGKFQHFEKYSTAFAFSNRRRECSFEITITNDMDFWCKTMCC